MSDGVVAVKAGISYSNLMPADYIPQRLALVVVEKYYNVQQQAGTLQ